MLLSSSKLPNYQPLLHDLSRDTCNEMIYHTQRRIQPDHFSHTIQFFCAYANLVLRARGPLGRGTKGSGIIHLISPQIVEIRYYCACAKFFKMEDMRTEIRTIFYFWEENMKNFLLFFCLFYIMRFIL